MVDRGMTAQCVWKEPQGAPLFLEFGAGKSPALAHTVSTLLLFLTSEIPLPSFRVTIHQAKGSSSSPLAAKNDHVTP